MNVTVENLGPCQKLVRVEIDAAAVDTKFEEVLKEFQKHANLSGFRKGKAPQPMVEKAYGSNIREETKRRLFQENLPKAMKEQGLDPVTVPDVEEVEFERGKPFQFTATVETAPDFELPDYVGLPIKRPSAEVRDEDVDQALNSLRERQSQYQDVERPAREGDFVVVNYKGTTEGKPLTEIAPTARGLTEKSNYWLQITPGSFIPGFTEQLVGMEKGQSKTIEVDFPQDFVAPALSGRKGTYDVEVVQVKEKVLPELNDEFAKQFEAESVEKLREGVRRDLENEASYRQKREVRGQVINTLLQRAQFDLPESLVQQETRNVVYDLVRENQSRGLTREAIEEHKDQIFSSANTSAKERVKLGFIFKRIAEKENIKVENEEMARRLTFLAYQENMRPQAYAKKVQESGEMQNVRDEVLAAKVLDFLEGKAAIEDVPREEAPQRVEG